MKLKSILLFVTLFFSVESFSQKAFQLASPNGHILVNVSIGDTVSYSITVNKVPLLSPSPIALLTENHKSLGIKSTFTKQQSKTVSETIINPVPHKRKEIPDRYQELQLQFKENFSITFRAYDDGVAYRFQTSFNDSLQVNQEIASFRFVKNATTYFPEVKKRDNVDIYHTSFEEPYRILELDKIQSSQIGFTPMLVDAENVKAVITESDLNDYPGMFLKGKSKKELVGEFAAYPANEKVEGNEFKQWVVTSRKNYIAKTSGKRSFPWRVIAIAEKDADLLMNDLVYRLATPAAPMDWSWIRPGISTEEWIVGSNLYNVPFKAGFNTETYKYYIDFASRFGLQYVMLDAGWSDNDDLMKITTKLNLEEIAAYAKTKNINLILWTLAMTLDRQLEDALNMFNRLGVKVILTDFMDRDDQKTINFYKRIAEASAKHKIMVMFHGAFKNAGFERTYPNAITREAILGSEYNIWSDKATPEHDLLIPFIRMIAGPMDYEPGFYHNANQKTFKPLPDDVMSMGTRTHQLAMFVAYESPIQMFSGNPSDAWPEVAYTTYLASLPTTWDETVVLDAKLGDYLLLARRKDKDWYLVAMTDWSSRDLKANLSFLGDGKFRAFTCEDGINAEKNARDYSMGYQLVDPTTTLTIHLAPGGGYVAKLIKLYDGRP